MSRRVAVFFTLLLVFWPNVLMAQTENLLPRPDTVTMIDLGAKSCVPCKMMAPILEKLETEYKGRADVVFIDIRDNPEQGQKFAIRAIPTQIFFNKSGQEVGRHEGFLSEDNIKAALDKLLSE